MIGRVLSNMSWVGGEQILRMGVGLLVTLALARYLGPELFGTYNLILATVGIVAAIVPLASDQVIQRELVANPLREHQIIGTAAALRAMATAVAILVSVLAILWIERDHSDRVWLAALGAATLVFQPFEIISVWFASKLKIRNITLAKSLSFLVVSVARIAAIAASASILVFLALLGLEAALTAAGIVFAFRMEGKSMMTWRITRRDLKQLFDNSWPLLIGGVASTLYMRFDIVMLAAMKGDGEVGIYGAATRLSEAWYFIPMALMGALQPVLFQLHATDPARFRERLRQTYTGLGFMSLLIAVFVSFIAVWLCTSLFGPKYAQAGEVLAVHIWAAIPVFLGVVSTSFLVAENHGRIAMYRTIMGLAVNVVLNLLLIPHYGAYGAALSTLVAYTVATFALIGFPATRAHGWDMIASLSPRAGLKLAGTAVVYVQNRQRFFK